MLLAALVGDVLHQLEVPRLRAALLLLLQEKGILQVEAVGLASMSQLKGLQDQKGQAR